MRISQARIGVFDSGIGGLTVLHDCMRLLPEPEYVYYGDNFNAPYGEKSREEILSLTRRAVNELADFGVHAVLLACNTATAVCAEALRAEFPFPVVGMEPAVKPAAAECERVLVLATPRTAESARLCALVESAGKGRITVFGAPRLAGAIERALCYGERLTISDHLPCGSYDGVVLGCTHYLYFRREIADFYAAKAFDGNFGTANRLRELLKERGFGIDDHRQPLPLCGKIPPKRVIFLGKGAKINERLYDTNICFQNI